MDRYRGLVEDGVIFLLMAVFTAIKQLLLEKGLINWAKTISKVFTNLIAGVGFYTFIISYEPWASKFPQKIGVIMMVVYAGSRLIDLVVDKLFEWFKTTDFKLIIKILFGIK